MEMTLLEAALLVAAVAGLYLLLRPLQRWIESALRRWLDPSRRNVIDAEIVRGSRKERKE